MLKDCFQFCFVNVSTSIDEWWKVHLPKYEVHVLYVNISVFLYFDSIWCKYYMYTLYKYNS